MEKIQNANDKLMNTTATMPASTETKPMMVYPEIFYKLQPYIMMVCDHMEFNSIMPNMQMVQNTGCI